MNPTKGVPASIGVAILVCLAACASVESAKRSDALESSLRQYGIAIRWGHYDAAVQFMRPRDKVIETTGSGSLNDIRVTSYDVVEQGLSDDQTEARLTVAISFYHVESGIVHRLKDQQVWWYDEDSKQWFLDGDLPDFVGALNAER